jgi:hypothetical protein
MGSRIWKVALCLLAWGLAPLLAEQAAADEVDLALVLAVDVSRSMDPDEQELQRNGFIEAFRSPLVHDAIGRGMLGRISVTYMEWSGEEDQRVVVPWTLIDGREAAQAFADQLARAPPGRIFQTSISSAIDFSVRLIGTSGLEPLRRVIDISGDGPNSSGRSVTAARNEAVAKGITINGLPIMLKRPSGFGDMEHLDRYYRDCVIGGQGAFIVPVRERHQFAEAIRTKIIREIAALPEGASIHRIQAEPPMDCATRQTYWRNQSP